MEDWLMKFLATLFPFMPNKGETTKFIVGLIFYVALAVFGIPIVTVLLSLTIVLAVLVAVVVPLMMLYSAVGILFAILNFAGVMNLASYKNKKAETNE